MKSSKSTHLHIETNVSGTKKVLQK